MPADDLDSVCAYVAANLSAGNAEELALIFGRVPEEPIRMCVAQSDHFHWFRRGDFAGVAGMGQCDPWTFSVWGAFSRGIEHNQMFAYEWAREALRKFDSLLPGPDCGLRAGIPEAFAAGRRFARHLGWREEGIVRHGGTPIVRLTRRPGDGVL